MSARAVSLNTKIDPQEKDLFIETCESLGMTPSSAIKVFVRVFNETGGFPFELRKGFPKKEGVPEPGESTSQATPATSTTRSEPEYDEAPRSSISSLFNEPVVPEEPAGRVRPVSSISRVTEPATSSASRPTARVSTQGSITPRREPFVQNPKPQEAAGASDPNDTAVLNRRELNAMMESVYGSVPQKREPVRGPEKSAALMFDDLDEPYGGFDQVRQGEQPRKRPRPQGRY